jgi:hypothetical protein
MEQFEALEESVAFPAEIKDFELYNVSLPPVEHFAAQWEEAYSAIQSEPTVTNAQRVCHTSNLYFLALFYASTRLTAMGEAAFTDRLDEFKETLLKAGEVMESIQPAPQDKERFRLYVERVQARLQVLSALMEGGPVEANRKTAELLKSAA